MQHTVVTHAELAEEDRLCALGTEAIFHAHAQAVSRWAKSLGGPGVDAQDVVQEVFIVVHRRLEGFRSQSRLTTWLYGITANVVHQLRRKNKLYDSLAGAAEDAAGHETASSSGSIEGVRNALSIGRNSRGSFTSTRSHLSRVVMGLSTSLLNTVLYENTNRRAVCGKTARTVLKGASAGHAS